MYLQTKHPDETPSKDHCPLTAPLTLKTYFPFQHHYLSYIYQFKTYSHSGNCLV